MPKVNQPQETNLQRAQSLLDRLPEKPLRILMDMTMTARWARAGVVVGITRTGLELFHALKQMVPVLMVTLVNGEEGTRMHRIDEASFETTEELVKPKEGDLFLMAEIQVRGVHVPMNYPTPIFLKEMQIDRCAVIYDILPITDPQYFAEPTSRGMPDYVVSLFRHFNYILCDSFAVCDSVEEFWKNWNISPFEIDLDFDASEDENPYLTSGWYTPEKQSAWTNGTATLNFYINDPDTDYDFFCSCRSLRANGETRFLCNGNEIGFLSAQESVYEGHLRIPKAFLKRDGVQTIQIVTSAIAENTHPLGVQVERIVIKAEDAKDKHPYEFVNDPIRMGAVRLGSTQFAKMSGKDVDATARKFFSKKKDRIYLMVGTVEPRKGHELALSAFESMWEKGYQGKLCILGRIGWNMQAFEEKLEEHPERGEKLLYLSHVSDATLAFAYEHAYALIQPSAGEGFGLPLIEAGQYGTLVLCSDIPVFHEVGGDHVLYFKRDERSLTECIQKAENSRAEDLPDSRKIPHGTWDDCAKECMTYFSGAMKWPYDLQSPHLQRRKKAVVTTTFGIWPPLNGGQARVYGLYRGMAQEYDVEILSFVPSVQQKRRRVIAQGLAETQIPRSPQQEQLERGLEEKAKVPVTDIATLLYSDLTPDYAETLRKYAADADMVIVCHPYTYNLVKAVCPDKTIVYEAQDMEYEIKKGMLAPCKETEKALKTLYQVERKCCINSKLIMVCSEEDRDKLAALYEISKDKIVVVPNGVDTESISYVDIAERMRNKSRLGLEDETIGVFMGSWHKPNLDGAEAIIEMADDCPDVRFLLMGSQCMYFENRELPENVGLLGLVTDGEKNRILSAADFALNPIDSGSGTNLKMFDYMAKGIPIVTTSFGTRGIAEKDIFFVSEIEDMADLIQSFQLDKCTEITQKAREYVEKHFDWQVIAKHLLERLAKME